MRNDIKICIIQMDQNTIMINTSYLYKFYYNRYNKYNFLVLLAYVVKNDIRILLFEKILVENVVVVLYLLTM